jgi:hypothetical protein
MSTTSSDVATHCAYCGRLIAAEADAPERFGERFCSAAHAEEFVARVREARMAKADRAAIEVGKACALTTASQPSWRGSLKRGICWAAPLLALIAIPLVWTGGWAATGGSLLTLLALLACPLGMYFMMRGMMNMHQDGGSAADHPKEDRRA